MHGRPHLAELEADVGVGLANLYALQALLPSLVEEFGRTPAALVLARRFLMKAGGCVTTPAC